MVAANFYACAGTPDTRKKALSWGGVAALLSLLAGIRMWQGMYGFEGGWVIVKLVCWLGLASITGMAYRKRAKAGLWMYLTIILSVIALIMVYVRPF